MTANLTPYLNLPGTAHEAMQHYQGVFGGQLSRSTYAEFGMATDPADADRTMHSQLVTERGWVLMAADTPGRTSAPEPGSGHSVALFGDAADAEDLRRYFAGLAEGGRVDEPLAVAPWGDEYGMVTDRFGVQWMVNIAGAPGEG